MIDFNTIKFRASSWGNLLSEPVTKADKEAGKLSLTCQKELIKIYNQVVYGRKTDITTKQMDKGIVCEPASVQLVSLVEGKMYFKNEDRLENEWFCGHPDIFIGDNVQNAEEISDLKTSWSMDTFMPKLIETVDRSYEAQLNCYYSLTGAKCGHLFYTLVSATPEMVEEEKYYILKRLNAATEYSPEAVEAIENLKTNMIFEDIDYRERVIKISVPRNEELIQKMKDKVPALRKWLSDFYEKHMNLYPK